MMEGLINVAFDAESLGKIAQMAEFHVYLNAEMEVAMHKIGDELVQAAVANTWSVFANPTGELASTIRAVLGGPMQVEVGSDSPYARRREYGFSGQTDSLGRYFANDPARPYMQPALEQNEDNILQAMGLAAAEAFAKMGVSL